MCGLYGVIFRGKAPPTASELRKLRLLFNTMAIVNADRGTDAAGLARVEAFGNNVVFKRPESVFDTVAMPQWNKVISGVSENTRMLLGHTRKKTHGENNEENAHPHVFVQDDRVLVGTHNGVVTNHEIFKDTEPFTSDSRNLFHKLCHTETSDITQVLEEVQGTFVLAFTLNDAVYLARNASASSCWIVEIPELEVTVYSSLLRAIVMGTAVADLVFTNSRELVQNKLYRFHRERSLPTTMEFNIAPVTTEEPKHVTTETYVGPTAHAGLRIGERMSMWPGVRGTIHCFECKSTKAVHTVRIINNRCICDQCWEARTKSVKCSIAGCETEGRIINVAGARVCYAHWQEHLTLEGAYAGV